MPEEEWTSHLSKGTTKTLVCTDCKAKQDSQHQGTESPPQLDDLIDGDPPT
jgi:hypothetical protein